MAKDTKGQSLKERLQGAVRSTKEAVANVDLSGVKEKLQETGSAAKEAVKKVKLPEVDTSKIKDVFKKGEQKTADTEGTGDSDNKAAAEPSEDIETVKPLKITAISTKNALKIIYYLMAADGQIFHSEEEKFNSIGQELDPYFRKYREQVIKECQAQLDKVIDPEDYYDTLQDGVEDALISSKETADTYITPKLLVWDLLTIAYSDESYDEAERKLLKYVVRKLNIDKAIFLEMESSILTLMDIEKELTWIKTTNKPYLTIEAMVNELADRKSVIFESIKDLIAL